MRAWHARRAGPTAAVLVFLLLAGCSGGDGTHPVSAPSGPSAWEAARKNGFTERVAEHGRGFLAEKPQLPAPGKRLLYLEGTHYQMGFQAGYLCPGGVATMAHEFTDQIVFDMLNIPLRHEDLGVLWAFVRAWLKDQCAQSEPLVPERLREEMRGIADGYEAARQEGRAPRDTVVTYGDVLLLNMGMDVLSALVYGNAGAAASARPPMACNQFVCWGPHTRDGRLLHGRDFQFWTAGVYQNESLLAVYRPLDARGLPEGHPFITVTAPGFVGVATGLNAAGLSVAIDVVLSWAAGRAGTYGLSGLLVNRIVMEEDGSFGEAVETIREAERGCPWLYVVADGAAREAAVLETILSYPPPSWMEARLAQAEALGSALIGEPFPCAFPDRGVEIRHADYVLPERFRGKGIELPFWHNNPKFADDHTFLNFTFYDPVEEEPRLMAVANHFFLPGMHAFEWAPLFSLAFMEMWPDTAWRYRTQVRELLERSTNGRSLDWESAWLTADFLDPSTPEGAFYWGNLPGEEVHGHVALMDNEGLEMRALFGYYASPVVDIRFGDFVR